jgi:predicted nucleic acid-binding protein
MNVFLDTNVLMDVLLERQPFALDAQRLWFLAERGKIEGAVSALSFANVYYVVRKTRGHDFALAMLKAMRDTFRIVGCDEQILQQAIDARFSDFEDAVQYFSALRMDAACMVSRNPGHFPKSSIPIFTPHDFFSFHNFSS